LSRFVYYLGLFLLWTVLGIVLLLALSSCPLVYFIIIALIAKKTLKKFMELDKKKDEDD